MSYKLGIDIGGTFVKIGAVQNEKVIKKEILKVERTNLIKDVLSSVSKFQMTYEISGIGIACAGLIDKKGVVRYSPNLPELNKVNLKEIAERKLGKKVNVINDANAQAIAEKKFGAGRKFKNFAYLTIGTGVGGAIILENKLYSGSHGFAGEFGHIKIADKGEKCNCGAYGCLESLIGANYIFKKHDMTTKKIAEEAEKGDKNAIGIFAEMGKYLGIGLAIIANALDVEAIIIGGGVSKAGELLLGPARKEFKKSALPMIRDEVKILSSKLGEDAGIIGASLIT